MTHTTEIQKVESFMDSQWNKIKNNGCGYRRNCKAYRLALKAIEHAGEKTRVGWSGKRFVDDQQYDVANILRSAGVSCTTGNDAPRGGVSGKYVIVNL